MAIWHELLRKEGKLPKWPYPIRYGEENTVEADVIILGGGIAGCHAAISAARKGCSVAVVEKGPTKYSGDGGAGVDHWLAACTNPCSTITPEEFTESVNMDMSGFDCGIVRYINAKESWDAALDCEQMGMKIRDDDDEFVGASFRDDETKLMFAYDYESKIDIRVHGHNVKIVLHDEMKKLGVQIYDRVMVTSLLNEGGKQGARVIGATGVNSRTGEFMIFKGKAFVNTMGHAERVWTFSQDLKPMWNDMNQAADSMAVCFKAGAEFVNVEQSHYFLNNPYSYISYGAGNYSNTWYPCSIVDADGKEIPYVDRDGNLLETYEDRLKPSPGQKFVLGSGYGAPITYNNQNMALTPTIADDIRDGKYKLPLYADLTSIPAHERRAIFGLMVGNEGKTRIPVYETYTKAGFNPDKDMLMVPIFPPEVYVLNPGCYTSGIPSSTYRSPSGGLLVDWNLKTSLDGLYAAGYTVYGCGAHSSAATGGRYAGRNAADYAKNVAYAEISREQIEAEKARVYAPTKVEKRKFGWKELNAGICRVMLDYCGEFRCEETLKAGLDLIKDIEDTEAKETYADNPHELVRVLECETILTASKMIIEASRARKSSNFSMGLFRIDYPDVNPPEWDKLLPFRLEGDKVVSRELPKDYYLQAPYADNYAENYEKYCAK